MDAILQKARDVALRADEIPALAGLLPAEDGQLDTLLTAAGAEGHPMPFVALVLAALDAGRRVDAHQIVEVVTRFGEPRPLVAAASKCKGDVAGPVLDAVRRGRFPFIRRPFLLLFAGWWAREDGRADLLPEVLKEARLIARRTTDRLGRAALVALTSVLDADDLSDRIPHGRACSAISRRSDARTKRTTRRSTGRSRKRP